MVAPQVRVDLGGVRRIAALRIWNYNKSAEDTYRGARTLHASLDGAPCSPPQFLLRRAPGNAHFDFGQELSLVGGGGLTPGPPRGGCSPAAAAELEAACGIGGGYECVGRPRGFVYQLQLLSSWGDPYYIGLNGLEMFDGGGRAIPLTERNIAAYPDSVNALLRAKGAAATGVRTGT